MKKGIEHNRLYRIAYVPIRYHVKVKSNANPYLPEFDKYFFKRTKWREDLAKECKQVTTFVMQETINHGRVSLRGIALKGLEPYAGKLARTVLRGRKLPGATIKKIR